MPLLKRNTALNLPSGWHQITIGQYEEMVEGFRALYEAGNAHREGKLTKEEHLIQSIQQSCIIIASATNQQPEDIRKQSLALINQQLASLDWLNDASGLRFVNEFEVEGTTYVVNPDVTTLTPDAFIHMNRVVSEKGPRWQAYFVALFIYPKGGSFDNEAYPRIAELMYQQCPCSVLLPLSNYFLRLSEGLRPHIEKHLDQQADKISNLLEEIKQDLEDEL